MAKFTIEKEKNRVIVSPVGYDEARPLFKCPSRRHKKTSNEFVIPFTRMNAEILTESSLARQMPPELTRILTDLLKSMVGTRQFPNWYKFKTTPLPAQRDALAKTFRNDVGALLMPMGTGKSKVLIDKATAHFYEKRIQVQVLLAPLTTTGVWMGPTGQLAIHSPVPTKTVAVDSSFDWTKHRPSSEEMLWLIVGLESLSAGKAVDRLLPFIEHYKCGIAVDESHWIKNRKAIRTENAMALRKPAVTADILTGTLATRNIVDLYSQYDWLDPNIIGVGDWYSFRNRYCLMGGFKRREIVGYDNIEELMGLIEPYTFICEVPKGMPPQVFMPPRQVRMSDEQFEFYQKVRKAEIEGISVKNVLNKVLKLHQICGGHLFLDPVWELEKINGKRKLKEPAKKIWSMPPAKNPKLLEMLEVIEQEPERKLLIWAKYLPEIEDIVEFLRSPSMRKKGFGAVAVMTGETENRAELVAEFQAGKYQFLVANQQTGGISWTMTRATRVHYFSNTDKLDDRLQSEKRAHRQGQDEAVVYSDYEMRTPKGGATVDTLVLGSIQAKKDLDQYIKDKIKEAGGDIDKVFI